MLEFTENQRAAVERTDGDVYVSAAAGSGKTAVLVERVVRLICDESHKIDADRILVVTFTRSAAAEVSARVKKSVDALLSKSPKNEWLRRQASLIRRASISTIHAFCLSLLREFWSELGIPPDFSLANDVFLDEMRQRALMRAAEQLYGDDEGSFRDYSDLFGRARSLDEALKTLDEFERFLSDIADPEEWKESCLKALRETRELNCSPAGAALFSFAEKSVCASLEMIESANDLIATDELLLAAYSEAFLYDRDTLRGLLELIKNRDRDGVVDLLSRYRPLRLNNAPKETDAQLKESARYLRDRVKDFLRNELQRKHFPTSEAQFRSDAALCESAAKALFRAADIFSREFSRIKLQRKLLDYNDLERYAIRLLKTVGETRDEILSRYDHILVDEYQDTNEVQDLLFNLLKGKDGVLFAVGDVKQSIYRFRRAEPEIFINRRKAAYPQEDGRYPANISLTHNFRSDRRVINAINEIFGVVMTEDVGEVDYSGGEALTTMRGEGVPDAGIDILLIEDDGDSDREARAVAGLISGMLSRDYEVEVRSGSETMKRKCRPGDFCVLLRAMKKSAAFEEALRKEGIPVNGDHTGEFFGSSEVEVLLALLSVIDNPKRDVDMAAVMLSPLFGFLPDDLLLLKGSERRRDLYSAMLVNKDERFVSFISRLSAFRTAAASMPVDMLLLDIIDETGALGLLTAGDSYVRRRNNIRILIDYAARLSRENEISLSQFLGLMGRKRRQNDPLSSGFSPSADAVNLLSVHKSKGLEWPVVFLSDAAKGFNYSDSRQHAVLFDRSLGIGIRHKVETDGESSSLAVKNTLHFNAIALCNESKMISEECRVMYVALTRAKQKAFITAAVKDPEKAIPYMQKNPNNSKYAGLLAKNFLDWALLGVKEDRRALLDALLSGGEYRSASISVRMVEKEQLSSAAEVIPKTETDPRIAEMLRERAFYRYPRALLAGVPTKVTASGLSHGEIYMPRAPSFMNSSVSDAALRGTAAHLFMQYADFSKAKESVSAELGRLAESGLLAPEQAGAVDIESLKRFFDSPLGSRLASGKILREYAFIDAIDAGEIKPLPEALAEEKVMVQGVVDCILFEGTDAVLIDYKTDRVDTGETLIERYHKQLSLYKRAVESHFPVKVTESYIYSFHLDRAVRL